MTAFIALSSLYIGFLIWCRYHWSQLKEVPGGIATNFTFSVVLPVRDEAENIQNLIADLAQQTYPHHLFEVILVDDASEDDTVSLAYEAFRKTDLKFLVIELSADKSSGKKQAITTGVQQAKNDIIITTDGDCRMKPGWVQAYANQYASSDFQMVTGPVKMIGNDFFTRLQSIEFSGLIGIGAASLQSGNPGMCNGANLSYKRSVFEEVRGYEGNLQIASGDDEFLLQKVFRKYPENVAFLKNDHAVVSTPAKPGFKELVNQRLRWSSKWKFHKSLYVKAMALLAFCNCAVFLWAFMQAFGSGVAVYAFTVIFLLRVGAMIIFAFPICRFFGIRNVPIYALVIEIIYPFVVIFLGIASIFGHYSWKRRRYS